jgi:Domain of unknown function (DUF222)
VLEGEELVAYWDEDGSLVVRGRLAPDEGAVLMRALDAARDSWRESKRGSAEPRRPTNAETLAAAADAALANLGGRPGADRYQVVVHVDATALAHDAGSCELEDGPAVAPETARRLACDASVVRLRERDGRPLNVGRKARTIPPALRRALTARDRGCRFPGCDNRRFVGAHNVRHWAKGGRARAASPVGRPRCAARPQPSDRTAHVRERDGRPPGPAARGRRRCCRLRRAARSAEDDCYGAVVDQLQRHAGAEHAGRHLDAEFA